MSTRNNHSVFAAEFTVRVPYVGSGADGARRSAQIDREEADGLDPGEARDRCLVSAEQWEHQADFLESFDRAFHPLDASLLDPAVRRQLGIRNLTGAIAPSDAAVMRQNPDQVPAAGEGS